MVKMSTMIMLAWGVALYAQTPDIRQYLSMIESGQADEVRSQLPSLMAKYPKNPGVIYLQGVLTTDGAEAVRIYQGIVDNYPNSEWADDALFKVYKFYQAIGLNRTAELKLTQLRTNYPNSKYLAGLAAADTKPTEAEHEPAQQPPAAKPKIEEQPTSPAPREPVNEEELRMPPVQAGKFALQVGAYSTQQNADRQRSFFEYHHYPAEIVRKMSGARELFCVYVGRFATESEAKKTGEEIRSSFNINYIVVVR